MSYFINPDGTISFIEDRYDSSGNVSVGRPYSMVDLNSIDYSKETVPRKRTKTKRHKEKTPVFPTLSIEDVFSGEELLVGKFVLENKKDILNLFKWLKQKDFFLTHSEADIIMSSIKKDNIKQSFIYRFSEYMKQQTKMIQDDIKET